MEPLSDLRFAASHSAAYSWAARNIAALEPQNCMRLLFNLFDRLRDDAEPREKSLPLARLLLNKISEDGALGLPGPDFLLAAAGCCACHPPAKAQDLIRADICLKIFDMALAIRPCLPGLFSAKQRHALYAACAASHNAKFLARALACGAAEPDLPFIEASIRKLGAALPDAMPTLPDSRREFAPASIFFLLQTLAACGANCAPKDPAEAFKTLAWALAWGSGRAYAEQLLKAACASPEFAARLPGLACLAERSPGACGAFLRCPALALGERESAAKALAQRALELRDANLFSACAAHFPWRALAPAAAKAFGDRFFCRLEQQALAGLLKPAAGTDAPSPAPRAKKSSAL